MGPPEEPLQKSSSPRPPRTACWHALLSCTLASWALALAAITPVIGCMLPGKYGRCEEVLFGLCVNAGLWCSLGLLALLAFLRHCWLRYNDNIGLVWFGPDGKPDDWAFTLQSLAGVVLFLMLTWTPCWIYGYGEGMYDSETFLLRVVTLLHIVVNSVTLVVAPLTWLMADDNR